MDYSLGVPYIPTLWVSYILYIPKNWLPTKGNAMEIDEDKIDEAVLALLHLTLHDGGRAWKSLDWDALGRLYEKGFIHNPVGKTKSVLFTEEGLKESNRLFKEFFIKES